MERFNLSSCSLSQASNIPFRTKVTLRQINQRQGWLKKIGIEIQCELIEFTLLLLNRLAELPFFLCEAWMVLDNTDGVPPIHIDEPWARYPIQHSYNRVLILDKVPDANAKEDFVGYNKFLISITELNKECGLKRDEKNGWDVAQIGDQKTIDQKRLCFQNIAYMVYEATRFCGVYGDEDR
ncbi:hypothetical protein OROHE_013644 [Orobanche hederae]